MTEQSMHKRPPSFPHIHPNRARKFKRAWVEKTKIKSKWKAQKKKEGLMERAKLDLSEHMFEEEDNPEEPYPSTSNHPNETVHEEVSPKTTLHSRSEDSSRILKNTDKPDGDDVRDLIRKAYSKSNLHTFKSDPLKKRAGSRRPKGEWGKGQPDMKLRMNALLAKIKQDHA